MVAQAEQAGLLSERMRFERRDETLGLAGDQSVDWLFAFDRWVRMEPLARAEPLPISLQGRVVYYVGPVDAVGDEAVGPAGPTTATRMDKFVEPLLAHTGLLAMIGKAERGTETIASICRHGSATSRPRAVRHICCRGPFAAHAS